MISKGEKPPQAKIFEILNLKMWISKGKTAPKIWQFWGPSPKWMNDPPLFSSGFGRKGGVIHSELPW